MAAGSPQREGAEAFTAPEQVNQRRYEALRAYFVDGATYAQAGQRFGYTRWAMIDSNHDEVLSSLVQAAVGRVGVQQNTDMRRISAWVAIAAVITMVAGIYGMNFEYMPELAWMWGYPAVLGVMHASACFFTARCVATIGYRHEWSNAATRPVRVSFQNCATV